MSGKLLVGSKYSTNCGTNLTIVEDSGWIVIFLVKKVLSL